METPFNINNCIKVRLTDRGRAIHRANYERLFHGPIIEKYPYRPPKEDADGWSKWQTWDFMAKFGSHMGIGLNGPVETEVKFITD